jgi:hypothetical protein
MFLDKTVIVVGAGASFEAGLPLGHALKSSISKLTKLTFDDFGRLKGGDLDFWQELTRSDHFFGKQQRVAAACAKISQGIHYVSSVDSFLEIHRLDADIQHCAKTAISKLILDGERKSKLHVNRDNIYNTLDPSRLEATWYQELAQAFFESVEAENLAAAFDPVTFISFNYDRCIEWFLFNAVQALYFLQPEQAKPILQGLQILHPYGEVGSAGWLGEPSGNEFGADGRGGIVRAQGRIQTFTERSVPEMTIELVRKAVAQARTIIFLGFSFHPQNMELLWPENSKGETEIRQVFGTSMGMSEQDRSTVQDQIVKRFGPRKGAALRVTLPPISCSEFMRQFKRSITIQTRME